MADKYYIIGNGKKSYLYSCNPAETKWVSSPYTCKKYKSKEEAAAEQIRYKIQGVIFCMETYQKSVNIGECNDKKED